MKRAFGFINQRSRWFLKLLKTPFREVQHCERSALSAVFGTALFLGSCVLSVCFGLPLLGQTDHAPTGWFLAGSKPANYRTGVDEQAIRDGRASAYLQSAVPNTDGFGTLMQSINASNYVGKRVRLQAWVKSQDVGEWSEMWMRVDREQTVVAFDNMQNRPIKGTQPWSSYDVVLDVPKDATSISFGVLLSGAGQVWMNHVTLEEVGKDTVITSSPPKKHPLSATPVNLNFSE